MKYVYILCLRLYSSIYIIIKLFTYLRYGDHFLENFSKIFGR